MTFATRHPQICPGLTSAKGAGSMEDIPAFLAENRG